MAFSTPSYDLIDLFNRIDRGDLQLPDFQRSFRWDVDRIRSLLVTVLRGYPMGSFMALDVRNEPPRFKSRPIAGAPDTGEQPGLLLLDGQQRLTTLYQCLRGDGIVESTDFRNKKVRRKFYVDVNKAVSADVLPDEAVIATDADGYIMTHFGPELPGGLLNRAAELAAGLLPVSELLSDSGTDLLFDLANGAEEGQRERTKRFNNAVLKPLVRYSVPMIRLDRGTAQEGIGSIFAQANSHGLQMDVFDLLTAVFKLEDENFSLKKDWEDIEDQLRLFPALNGIGQTEFLTAVALHVTAKKGHADAHREAIVNLKLAEYQQARRIMLAAFKETAEFLSERCMHTTSQVPYTAQLIPLAVIIALLTEDPSILARQSAWDRLNRWFWCGVFGELYGAPTATVRAATDVEEVTAWVAASVTGAEAQVPRSVRDARFIESRLLSAGPNSGLYKGIYALLMGRGARDWRTGSVFDRGTFFDLGVHFRQIFPARWCADNGIDPVLAESVLNRTPMGRRTYVMVEDSSPARYLYRLQSKALMDDAEFDAVLGSHLCDANLLLAARAEEFFRDRRRRFVEMIEQAMDSKAVRDVNEHDLRAGEEGPAAFVAEVES